MNPAVLRALVDEAYASRSTSEFDPKCEQIVRVWTRWPLVQAMPAIEAADRELAARRARIADALQALRDSCSEETCAA
jgi:hypothetical protein